MSDVTRLVEAAASGDRRAAADLLPLVYAELRQLGRAKMAREQPGQTLQPTALVHEAYLRLAAQDRVQWRNRAHFMGVAAQLMRRVLVDHARATHAQKRGGHDTRVSIDDVDPGSDAPSADIFALDEALTRLATLDPRQARIVELRYFGGLTVEEVAEALDISPATVKRHWTLARAFLKRELTKK